MDNMKPYSVSKINCFLSCPMKYRLQYLSNGTIVPESSDALIKGFKIGLDIKDNKIIPCAYSNKCLFRGVIDVLNGNNILDYKTGKYRDKPDWKQLAYYAIWLFLSSDYDTVNLSYLYVEHNKENSMTIHRDNLDIMLKSLIQRIKAVKEYEDNPQEIYNPSYLCDYCGVRKYCKMNVDNLENQF